MTRLRSRELCPKNMMLHNESAAGDVVDYRHLGFIFFSGQRQPGLIVQLAWRFCSLISHRGKRGDANGRANVLLMCDQCTRIRPGPVVPNGWCGCKLIVRVYSCFDARWQRDTVCAAVWCAAT